MMPNIVTAHRDGARRLVHTRRASVVCAAFIVLVALLWELWLAPTGHGTLALKAVPLALAIPGLWRGTGHTYRRTSLLVWLYAAEGATRAATDHGLGAVLAALELLGSLALFAALVAHLRRRPTQVVRNIGATEQAPHE